MSTDSAHPCVLLVEDEMLLVMMLQDMLEDAGYRVVKAARLPAALALADSEAIDAAVLDINIAGAEVYPVADRLRQRGVPFLFASGYGDLGLPGEYRDAPVLQKPYGASQMMAAVHNLLDAAPARA